MKTIVTLSLLIPFVTFSRNHSDDEILNSLRWGSDFLLDYQYMNRIYIDSRDNVVKLNKVHHVMIYSMNRNGKKEFGAEKTYNEKGYLIQYKNRYETCDYVLTDSLLTEVIQTTKKGDIYNIKCEYDNEQRVVHLLKMKNGKKISETTCVYFDGKQRSLVEQRFYTGKKKSYRLETDYDPILKKATETRFLVNGSLKQKWTFNCDERGEVATDKVKEVTECKYTTSDADGSFTTYSRTVEDGKIYLDEMRFDKDSSLVEYKRFFNETTLIAHQINTKNKITVENFKENGKPSYMYVNEYDDRGNRTAWTHSNGRGRVFHSAEASYSENDLIQKVVYKKGNAMSFEYSLY